VKDLSDSSGLPLARPTRVRHLVLAALCAITTINYLQRNSIGGAETTIRQDLGLTIQDTGDAISAFFLTYALCQVPSGWLAQRWGGKQALTLYAAGWSIVMAFSALAASADALVVDRWAMGALQAGIFPCCTMILASWYPATRRGFASAVLTSFMLIGGVIASVLTGLLIGALGWRWLFLLYAAPGLLWAAWFALWFRNQPEDHPGVNIGELAIIRTGSSDPLPESGPLFEPAETPIGITAKSQSLSALSGPSGPTALTAAPPLSPPSSEQNEPAPRPAGSWGWIILSLMTLLLICVQQFCRAGALRFFDFWLPTYLQEARGQSRAAANLWTSLPLWTGVVGSMTGGILSDFVLARTASRRAARQGVAVGGILLGLFCCWLAYGLADVGAAMSVAAAGVCLISFSSPCAYALTMDMGGRNLGVIFATMNMAGNLGAWAFNKAVPRVVISSAGWNGALLLFAVLYLVAVVCWLLINPNGTIGERPTASVEKE
jgi:sugar phosphate permease